MNGYYDIVDDRVVWRFFKDVQPDIIPEEIRTDLGIFPVVRDDPLSHNEEVRLPDVGRSVTA